MYFPFLFDSLVYFVPFLLFVFFSGRRGGESFELICEFSERQQKMLIAGGLLKYTKGE